MRRHAARLAGHCLGAAAIAGVPVTAQAQTTQTGMIVSAGVSADSNPFATADGKGAAVAATATLNPFLNLRDASTEIQLSGTAQFRRYFNDYGLEDNYSLTAAMRSRRSDRLTLRSTAVVSSNEGGFNRSFGALASPFDTIGSGVLPTAPTGNGAVTTAPTGTDPVAPPPIVTINSPLPIAPDVAVIGSRVRTTGFGVGGGLDATLTGRSTLSADVNVQGSRYAGNAFGDFNNANGELRYSHRLTELTSVGLIGSIGRTDYLGRRAGDSTTASGLVSLDRRFNARWSASIAVGASYSAIRQHSGQPDAHLTALNVRGQFCWTDPLQRLCVNAQRQPQPSAVGSVRVTNSLSADYSRRLSERETLGVSGTYTREGRGRGVAADFGATELLGGSARYDRQIAERTSLFVSASATRINGSGFPRRSNYGAALGIQFRLGAF